MTRPHDGRCILIAGPTASGKSGLALSFAERFGGVVINADSMQVYRELAVLTARPTPEEEARAPHALYGFVSGAEAYSAGRYARDVAVAIEDARGLGRVPIIAGGTGLYFKVLLEGLSPIPPVDADVRAHWRAQAATLPAPELHAILRGRDSEMAARLMPTDPQRIVRALEVLESTGRSLADWQRQPGRPVLAEDRTAQLLVLPDRAPHHRGALRCHDRRRRARRGAGPARSASLRGAADHARPRRRAAGRPPGRRARPGGRGHARKQRDAPVRQAAGNLASAQYACVEASSYATNGKSGRRYFIIY
jgi:tRNA dimethylallyltransferase